MKSDSIIIVSVRLLQELRWDAADGSIEAAAILDPYVMLLLDTGLFFYLCIFMHLSVNGVHVYVLLCSVCMCVGGLWLCVGVHVYVLLCSVCMCVCALWLCLCVHASRRLHLGPLCAAVARHRYAFICMYVSA